MSSNPLWKSGKNVICDRFSDSTWLTSVMARGLAFDAIQEINQLASQGSNRNITFLLDISPETGLSRKKKVRKRPFLIEKR